MATKADLQRTRQSLTAERLRLKQLGLELEERRRAQARERERAIVALRLLCAKHGGDTDWADDTELAEIIERHLARPLLERLERQVAEAAAPPEAPRPAVPEQLPLPAIPGHTPHVAEEERRAGSWLTGCSCGWRTSGRQDWAGAMALAIGHIQRMAPEGSLRAPEAALRPTDRQHVLRPSYDRRRA